MAHVILRLPEVQRRLGNAGRSSVYDMTAASLLPPPVRFGAKASGWVEVEIDAVIGARISGKSDAEIKDLVHSLVASRKQLEAA